MKSRNAFALTLIAISFVVLIPGLSRDLITLRAAVSVLGQEFVLFDDTRSIVGTVGNLYESGNWFVASLILLFSVVVPFVKGVMLAAAMAMRSGMTRYRMFSFVRSISKWAMCDVFVVGVYVAFLSAKATDNLDATIRDGFYWFAAYCLISLLALQFMDIRKPEPTATPK